MTTPDSLRIAFIGGGNMSRALIGGLLGQGQDPKQLTVAEPAEATRRTVA